MEIEYIVEYKDVFSITVSIVSILVASVSLYIANKARKEVKIQALFSGFQ